MREENGIIEIERAIDKLSRHHIRHIKVVFCIKNIKQQYYQKHPQMHRSHDIIGKHSANTDKHSSFAQLKVHSENISSSYTDHLIKDNPKNILILQAYDPHEGKDNERRLTGTSETSSIHDFSAGVSKCYFQIP